jgi:hypothetical protein
MRDCRETNPLDGAVEFDGTSARGRCGVKSRRKYRSATGEPPAISLVGGGSWSTALVPLTATWPLVRLDQFAWGIRVGPNPRFMSFMLTFMPPTEMSWEGLLIVRRTGSTLRFTTKSAPNRWVSFRPGTDPRLIAAIVEHGVNYHER